MATDLATLQARLDQAEEAYFQLSVGGQVREIQDQSGDRVAYTATNATGLLKYIMLLQQQIAALGGPAAPLGPMRVIM